MWESLIKQRFSILRGSFIMKKNLLALSVATALLATASVASAAVSDTGYFGARLGYANADWNSSADAWESKEKSGLGGGVYGGYSLSEYFSLEGAYNYIGGFEAQNGVDTKDVSIHGPELSARFSLPVNDAGSDIFLRGGVMYAMGSGSDGEFAPVVGVGLNLMLNDNLAFRIGYDRYFETFDAEPEYNGIDFDVDLAYVGLNYVFGKSAPAPVAEPVTQTITNTYTLDANTTFGFDSAELSEQGKTAVNQVILEAQNSGLEFVQYQVTGHTDRIGNPAYNQKLSERRAQSVADELVAKGVSAADISAVGVGSSEPVTGTECDNLGRKDMIKCTAADRRVEVKVTGTTTKTETVNK